jgi:hypothetical protein
MRAPTTATTPGAEAVINVVLKSVRNPPLDMRLPSQSSTTSILELKNRVAGDLGVPVAKVKLLQNKKPVADSKVLKELVAERETAIELAVMVMGGVPAKKEAAENKVEAGDKRNVVASEKFWEELRVFLLHKVGEENAAEEMLGVFKAAWDAR